MPCITDEQSAQRTSVNLNHYGTLHQDGKGLIKSWFNRAWQLHECVPRESFEPFIFTWIAFNGWAACVTGKDADREWIQALSRDETIRADFKRLSADNQDVSCYTRQFSEMWPIFKAQRIRRLGVQANNEGLRSRSEIVQHYFNNNVTEFAPKCWKEHEENGTTVPIDWPHTLEALYRVRNNLFHGEKSTHSEMDQSIVHLAYNVLVRFLMHSGYLS